MDNMFFIKKGYKDNDTAKTYETEFVGEYWNDERIKTSSVYQYDVYKFAASLIKKKNYQIGIDLGCGPGTKGKWFLAPYLKELILIDQPNCKSFALKALPKSFFYGVDLENLSLNLENKADIIICADVIEHLSNPLPTLEFCRDSIKNNGIIIISTPERDILRGRNCFESPHASHVREWNKDELNKLLEFIGLKIIDHKLLPPKKLTILSKIIMKAFGPIGYRKEWHSCQMVICTI
ncbi:methyltransferase domain-containing protein [Echinicola jeungdonensis]|uniref:Class I SAM-dependent methyltransferase n=1 Tax=Echinicola jeungdonensis TaxID=709343 RepID=A0ABV5J4C7_9BACT|nr:methyltransferase domain-containing protein [Echinicola jeungdonensis]MDN3667881.1 methyltransferase domain-containing protein [Echinicola jeungdonensis]